MLYYLFYRLHDEVHVFNVFKYITFRALCASLTALLITLFFGKHFIKILVSHQFGQTIRSDGPETHLKKKGTPTMGGILILFAILFSTLLWSDLTNPYIWVVCLVTAAFGLIGWLDDFKKIREKNSKGLSERAKMILQTIVAVATISYLSYCIPVEKTLHFPFFRTVILPLGFFYLPFAWCVMVGTSNAVNLTDGLDGLAIGPIITTAMSFAILSYLAGNVKLSEYLFIPYVKDAGELTIFCSTIVCAGMGFLWYNTYPAQVFMGDVGALALGAALGTVAVITKNELLLVLIGGIFVIEAISVITQRVSYKTRHKRVFRMAPIHHHFELSGWAEPQVTVRFWIISFMLAMLGLATLKLR